MTELMRGGLSCGGLEVRPAWCSIKGTLTHRGVPNTERGSQGWAIAHSRLLVESSRNEGLCARPVHGRTTDRPDRRALENPRHMPAPFRADHDVGVDPDGDGLGVGGHVECDLDVIKVGEHELPAPFERLEPEPAPEIEHPLPRVAVDLGVALAAAQLDAGAHALEAEPRLAELAPHREPRQ